MDLDRLARSLASPRPRRRVLAFLAALPIAGGVLGLPDAEEAAAKDRRRRRKQRHKRRKHPGANKRKGCTPKAKGRVCAGMCGPVKSKRTCGKTVDCGPCRCDPACNACAACDAATRTCITRCAATEDCCGERCVDLQIDPANCGACGHACGSGAICVAGACQTCDVTCGGNAAVCGAALQDALDGLDATIYVCPGTYAGGFEIHRGVTVIGAGDGDDPASNTILDGALTHRVVDLPDNLPSLVTLERLRVTRGRTVGSGAGILAVAMPLHLRHCTLLSNHADESGAGMTAGGAVTLTDCRIAQNTAGNQGGGLLFQSVLAVTLEGQTIIQGNTAERGGGIAAWNVSLTIGERCRVTGNTATADSGGGGIYTQNATVTLEGPNPTAIVVDNCHRNCAGSVAVANCEGEGVCPA